MKMLENILDGLHSSITHRWYFQLFTAFTRILLAVGFIPPSYKKMIGQPFTALPDSHPVGHYFNALLQTGFYYEFIGWAQMIAAILLLFPRTAHLGALMFFPIILNIAVLTTSVGFVGTWLITILMTFAALWLVAWDYDRLKPILFRSRDQKAVIASKSLLAIPPLFAFCGVAAAYVLYATGIGNFQRPVFLGLVLAGLGFAFGAVLAAHIRFMKVGPLK